MSPCPMHRCRERVDVLGPSTGAALTEGRAPQQLEWDTSAALPRRHPLSPLNQPDCGFFVWDRRVVTMKETTSLCSVKGAVPFLGENGMTDLHWEISLL